MWRLFNQLEAGDRRQIRYNMLEPHNPGHLVCMLYATQVCPFWSRPAARLGKDSMTAPGARRGSLATIMGFSDYELLIPTSDPIRRVEFLYLELVEEVRFRDPVELRDRYLAAVASDIAPTARRAYWTESYQDQRDLERIIDRGMKRVRGSRLDIVRSPTDTYARFLIPLFGVTYE